MISRKAVLLITDIPNPYRIPLFNELNRQLTKLGYEFKVLFGSPRQLTRRWQVDMSECEFAYQILPTRHIRHSDPEKSSYTYSRLFQVISEARPVIVITNGFSIATTKLWMRSWVSSLPYVIWSGAVESKIHPVSALRTWQRRRVVSRASGFIAYGTRAKEYLAKLGADPRHVSIGINTVDTTFFAKQTALLRNTVGKSDGLNHLLYVGYLTQRKNVLKLLHAVKLLIRARSDFVLDIVGDGTDADQLKRYVHENELGDRVLFHGFRQKKDLPAFFSKCDCFLFQTDFDIWGLVLVEAMAAGVPCIASINAGAVRDLIQDGVTGFAMDFSDAQAVAERIRWVLDNPEASRKLGLNARQYVETNAGLAQSASGFVQAITRVLEKAGSDSQSGKPVTS